MIRFLKNNKRHLFFLPIAAIFIALVMPGIDYGLPDNTHLFSYNCDEGQWIIGLNNMRISKERFPNPKLIQPTFYLWVYGTSLWLAEKLDYLNPADSPKDVIPTRFVYARVHLAGRYAAILFSLLTLMTLWLTAFRFYGLPVAVLSTLLVAICPGFIALNHFSYTNVPVTTLAFMSIACLIYYLQAPKATRTSLYTAAFLAGLASATKYSAFALAFPLIYAAWIKQKRWALIFHCGGFAFLAFVIGCPFLILTPTTFFEGFTMLSRWLQQPIPGLWNKIIFPFAYPFPYLMGASFFWVSVLACVWLGLKKDRVSILLLLWLGGILAGAYRCGSIATPGRLLIALPALALITGQMMYHFIGEAKSYRTLACALAVCLYVSTLLPTLAVVHLHSAVPVQKRASQWIWDHIPRGTPIGTVEHAFHWTPDIMYPTAPDIKNYKPYHPLVNLEGSIVAAKKMQYLLVAEHQRWRVDPEFFQWLESGKDFELVQEIRRDLRFGTYVWNRPESPFSMSEDDLFVNSTYIYRKLSK